MRKWLDKYAGILDCLIYLTLLGFKQYKILLVLVIITLVMKVIILILENKIEKLNKESKLLKEELASEQKEFYDLESLKVKDIIARFTPEDIKILEEHLSEMEEKE